MRLAPVAVRLQVADTARQVLIRRVPPVHNTQCPKGLLAANRDQVFGKDQVILLIRHPDAP
jgi:hypothetical protein